MSSVGDRLLREVTREEWLALPVERSYGKADDAGGKTRYYEIITEETPDA